MDTGEKDEVRITETAQAEERQSMSGNISLVFFHDLTRLGFSPSEAQKTYQGVSLTVDPKEGHALCTTLMKNIPGPENWIMPLDLQASHRSCLVSLLYPSTSCCLKTGVFSPLCAFPET